MRGRWVHVKDDLRNSSREPVLLWRLGVEYRLPSPVHAVQENRLSVSTGRSGKAVLLGLGEHADLTDFRVEWEHDSQDQITPWGDFVDDQAGRTTGNHQVFTVRPRCR